jgi:hypothetical protein
MEVPMKKIVALLIGVGFTLSTLGPRDANAANTLTRVLDPVVVVGSTMPDFAGVPLGQLFVYKYSGGVWSQIPWQFDEVDAISGLIVSSANGLLDAQDQLAFMAADAGDQAPAHAWLNDASAATYPRYELAVNDPLSPTQHAWVYVYRSQTLSSAILPDYVSYDAAQALLTSDRYKLGQMTDHPVFNRLELNGNPANILDRTKIRVNFFFLGLQTEMNQTTTPPDLTRAGHVRVVLNGGGIIAYRAFYSNRIDVNVTSVPVPITWGRFSADLSPAASGSTYYDPNVPAGVVINGVPDTVPASPAADWSQVSGATGTVVRIIDFSGAGGTATTYYKDNSALDSSDTGDQMSYGDAGVRIDSPPTINKKFVFWNWNYILPANQSNVGATFRDYARNPLQVTATETQPFTTSPVTIGRSGASGVVLTWAPVSGADFYRVWYHSEQPYFTSGGTLAQESANTSFTHAIAPADLNNYFYIVRAVDTVGSDNFESVNSNRTGKFTFTLVPGTG